jgi:hypothetical protein
MPRLEMSFVAEQACSECYLMERMWEGGIDPIIEKSGCSDM